MARSLTLVSEEVERLRALVLDLLAEGRSVATGIVALEIFALAVRRSPRTIKNDLLSKNPSARLRWPEFTKAAAGAYVTTPENIRAWLRRTGRSTHFDPQVTAALQRVAGRRARA